MYKLTQQIAKISDKIEVDVTMFIRNNDGLISSIDPKSKNKTVTRYNIEGNTYVKFLPSPFIDIILDPFNKEYNAYRHIRCDKMDVYRLIKALDKMMRHFIDKVDLFYYYDNKLTLNENIKNDVVEIIRLRERVLKIEPSVIMDADNIQHEGVTIYVNSPSIYTIITFSEMEYLLYILKTTNVDTIVGNLYLINLSNKVKEDKEVSDRVNNYELDDLKPNVQNDSTISYATPKNGNTIPNI